MNTTQEGLTGGVYLVIGGTQGIGEAEAMSHDLGVDLGQLLLQRGQRPVLCLSSTVDFSFGSRATVPMAVRRGLPLGRQQT